MHGRGRQRRPAGGVRPCMSTTFDRASGAGYTYVLNMSRMLRSCCDIRTSCFDIEVRNKLNTLTELKSAYAMVSKKDVSLGTRELIDVLVPKKVHPPGSRSFDLQ